MQEVLKKRSNVGFEIMVLAWAYLLWRRLIVGYGTPFFMDRV